jgi:multiple sugar transport system substrate-binding protein
MEPPKKSLSAAAVGAMVMALAACSSGEGSGEDAASATLDGRGPIPSVQGEDNSGVVDALVDKWNADHPDEKVTFKELTDEAAQQHDDMVHNPHTKNKE